MAEGRHGLGQFLGTEMARRKVDQISHEPGRARDARAVLAARRQCEPGDRLRLLEGRELIGPEAEAERGHHGIVVARHEMPVGAGRQSRREAAEGPGRAILAEAEQGARHPVLAGDEGDLARLGAEAGGPEEGGVGQAGHRAVQRRWADRMEPQARARRGEAVKVAIEFHGAGCRTGA